MNNFKQCKVILLRTDNIVNSLKGYEDTSLLFQYKKEYKSIDAEKPYVCNYHLYIISDDEIKEGDWCLNIKTNELFKANNLYKLIRKDDCKKIIATTDTSLIIGYTVDFNSKEIYLPIPSQQFITKYIESYNKSEVITDVLVEMEIDEEIAGYEHSYLKVNSKDNTITIKKLKDSWNREEVIDILHKYGLDLIEQIETKTLEEQVDINTWIEQNL